MFTRHTPKLAEYTIFTKTKLCKQHKHVYEPRKTKLHRLADWVSCQDTCVFPKCCWPMSRKSSAVMTPSLSLSHKSNIILRCSTALFPSSIGSRRAEHPYSLVSTVVNMNMCEVASVCLTCDVMFVTN